MRVDPVWAGKTAVLVGSGESLTTARVRLIAMARAKDLIRVVAINDAIYPCWFSDIAYACDVRWWRHHGPLGGFKGEKYRLAVIRPGDRGDRNDPGLTDVRSLEMSGVEGFDKDPSKLRSGLTGGYQAIHLSVHLGVKKILLVAYDMKGRHFFGDHPPEIEGQPKSKLQNMVGQFRSLAEELSKRGVTVLNTTTNSAIDVFPSAGLEKELSRLEKEHARRNLS